MEETNYTRPPQLHAEAVEADTAVDISKASDPEKSPVAESLSPAPSTRAGITGQSQKSLLQKMALFRREDVHKNNKMKGMILRPLVFLTFPVIFAAGFMYGSILCYFNILNGTTSLILSAAPYNFSSSMVGLTYIATLLGSATGYVVLAHHMLRAEDLGGAALSSARGRYSCKIAWQPSISW